MFQLSGKYEIRFDGNAWQLVEPGIGKDGNSEPKADDIRWYLTLEGLLDRAFELLIMEKMTGVSNIKELSEVVKSTRKEMTENILSKIEFFREGNLRVK